MRTSGAVLQRLQIAVIAFFLCAGFGQLCIAMQPPRGNQFLDFVLQQAEELRNQSRPVSSRDEWEQRRT